MAFRFLRSHCPDKSGTPGPIRSKSPRNHHPLDGEAPARTQANAQARVRERRPQGRRHGSSIPKPQLSARYMPGIPLLEPGGEYAHQRGEDGVDRADEAGCIRLHDEARPDRSDQVQHAPRRGQDAVRPHEDRIAQCRFPVIAVLGIMRSQWHFQEARNRPH